MKPHAATKPKTIWKFPTTTKKQRKRIKKQLQEKKEKKEKKDAEYERLRVNWLSKCGNLDDFGIWCSVNIMNHELKGVEFRN